MPGAVFQLLFKHCERKPCISHEHVPFFPVPNDFTCSSLPALLSLTPYNTFIRSSALHGGSPTDFWSPNPSDLPTSHTNPYVSCPCNPPVSPVSVPFFLFFTMFFSFIRTLPPFPHYVLLIRSACPQTYIYSVTIYKQA